MKFRRSHASGCSFISELYTDTVGMQSAKILWWASQEEVEYYFIGPRVEYKVIPEHISECTRISFLAAADFSFGVQSPRAKCGR